jgi:hypothetical protein
MGVWDQCEGAVLFHVRQQLYEGNYKLRKDVTYNWPFKVRFPAAMTLLPSGDHGKHMMSIGETEIVYQLKAFRATSAEQAKALADTTTQSSGACIIAKVRSLGASTVSLGTQFFPLRPKYVDVELTPTREQMKLPALVDQPQQPPNGQSRRFSLKSIHNFPNRVTLSPLNKDFVCNFFSHARRSSVPSEYDDNENTASHKGAIDALFAVSRLLTSKNINPQVIGPRNPLAVMSLLLPGQVQAKHPPMPEDHVIPHGTTSLPDPFIEDQKRLFNMLEGVTGFRSAKTQSSGHGSFAYAWVAEESTAQTILDFSGSYLIPQ